MKKTVIILSILFLGIMHYSQAQVSYTVTNGSPVFMYGDCSYTVSASYVYTDGSNSFNSTQSAIIAAGQSHTFSLLIPRKYSIVSVEFSASTTNFSQSNLNQTVSQTPYQYQGNCHSSGTGYVTFWQPIGNNTFHIWNEQAWGTK